MDYAAILLKQVVTLFLVIGPINAVPLFLEMTVNDDPAIRLRTARLAAMTTGITLLIAAFAGQYLLKLFGISMPAFQVAGGLLILVFAADMLHVRASRLSTTNEETKAGTEKAEVGVSPLGIPMLSGPGSIITVMVLRGQSTDWIGDLLVGLAVVITTLLAWGILIGAAKMGKRISPIAMGIAMRLLGLVLAALAIEMVLKGVQGVLKAG